MKITAVEILVAGAGWRYFNFLKISTDEGLIGWADFSEGNVGGVIAPLIRHIGKHLIGKDPRNVQPAIEELRRRSWGASIGATARAIGPMENVASHNYCGPMATLITAAFGGVVPNFRVMETDNVQVPWAWDLLTEKPVIRNGHIELMKGPGWGAEINEDAVAEHPPIAAQPGPQ